MSCIQTQIDYARLQTPRDDRKSLVEPPLQDVSELVAENLHDRTGLYDYDLHGRRLGDVSLQARAELLAAARRWTGAYRDLLGGDGKGDSPIFAETNIGTVPANIGTVPAKIGTVPAKIGTVPSPDPNGLIYLAGHQPQMFHPGVWFKNFVLGELARRDGATAVNLIIDGDTLSDAALRVPGGSVDEPHAAQIPFDLPDPDIPYEERRIEDRELFDSFARRATEQMRGLVADPLLAAVLAAGFGAGAGLRQSRCLPGPGSASVGGVLGLGNIGGAAELAVPGRGVSVVRRAFARLSPGIPQCLQRFAA